MRNKAYYKSSMKTLRFGIEIHCFWYLNSHWILIYVIALFERISVRFQYVKLMIKMSNKNNIL